jgi:hypothetical protein
MAELGLRAVIAHLPNSARSTVVFDDGNNEVQHPPALRAFEYCATAASSWRSAGTKSQCLRRRDLFRCSVRCGHTHVSALLSDWEDRKCVNVRHGQQSY